MRDSSDSAASGPPAVEASALSLVRIYHALQIRIWRLSMLRGFLLIQFVFYVLCDDVGVGTDDAPAVDEDRGGAGDLEGQAVCVAGFDGGGGFGAGETGLEGVGIQADLRGVVGQLGVGIFGRDDVLIVVDEVVKLPEGLGLLVIGAAASYGGT